MKKLITLFAMSIFTLNIQSAELLPLTDFMKTADPNDPVSFEMIAKRCSAINLAMTNYSREGDQVYELAIQNYVAWFHLATEARALKYPEDNFVDSEINIRDSVLNIAKMVNKEFTNNQDLTGSLFKDTFLEDDINVCGDMITAIYAE